ncbi:hypothetical protein RHGRI_010294 [Rhododendron griersonianum]|uniref:Uncharacterized protein n=1 Tax=Rhododendron griersonianum TaxID=479676 RepID=A0AAV6KHX6_9ERIC|nr:hypothetical protein RHGRI_010294 [Rhododendron griersonianum]
MEMMGSSSDEKKYLLLLLHHNDHPPNPKKGGCRTIPFIIGNDDDLVNSYDSTFPQMKPAPLFNATPHR